MFAKRTDWELSSNQISTRLNKLRQSGKTILDLTVSNPTQCGFSYPKEIFEALNNQINQTYAPIAQGLEQARLVVSNGYAAQGFDVPPERIFLTASTSEAYSFLFRLLANPYDSVLFPRPSYPLFQFLGDLNDVYLNFYSLEYQKEWRINCENFKAVVTPETKAVVLVSPNNPTGSFVKEEELREINSICRQHQLPIICDEVFRDFAFSKGTEGPSLVNNQENLTFTLGGLSKSLGLPQMKLSWIIVNGPKTLVEEALARLDVIADTYLSVNTPVQNALGAWFDLKEPIEEMILNRIQKNRKFLQNAVSGNDDLTCLQSDGGWYSILRLPEHCQEDEFVISLLEKRLTFVHPGYFFDFDSGQHIVLSLLPEEKIFQDGIQCLVEEIPYK